MSIDDLPTPEPKPFIPNYPDIKSPYAGSGHPLTGIRAPRVVVRGPEEDASLVSAESFRPAVQLMRKLKRIYRQPLNDRHFRDSIVIVNFQFNLHKRNCSECKKQLPEFKDTYAIYNDAVNAVTAFEKEVSANNLDQLNKLHSLKIMRLEKKFEYLDKLQKCWHDWKDFFWHWEQDYGFLCDELTRKFVEEHFSHNRPAKELAPPEKI